MTNEKLAILNPFQSILVISGQLEGDNGRLCAMETHLPLERFLSPAG